jgi:hypothetical protein
LWNPKLLDHVHTTAHDILPHGTYKFSITESNSKPRKTLILTLLGFKI